MRIVSNSNYHRTAIIIGLHEYATCMMAVQILQNSVHKPISGTHDQSDSSSLHFPHVKAKGKLVIFLIVHAGIGRPLHFSL